jgi:hypothetical protein
MFIIDTDERKQMYMNWTEKEKKMREYQRDTFLDDSTNIGKLISDKDNMHVTYLN